MVMQIRRTPTPDNPPPNLAEGQLAVEMASDPPKLWCGVPTAIDVSGRICITPLGTRVGDVRFDSGKLERWDGTAWVEISVGGWPVQGVTDGSSAAPGEVGEELASSILTYSLSNMLQDFTNTPMSGGQPVPAGDWLVYGAVSVTLGAMTVFNAAGFVGYSVSLDNGLSSITDSFYVGATTLGTYPPFAKSYRLTPARLRLSAPRTLPVTASVRLMTVTVPANVQIQFSLVGRALRVR